MKINCYKCDGTGRVPSWVFFSKDCDECNGEGKLNMPDPIIVPKSGPTIAGPIGHFDVKGPLKEEKKKAEKEEKCPWCFAMIPIAMMFAHKNDCPDRPGNRIYIPPRHEEEHHESYHHEEEESHSFESHDDPEPFDSGGFGGGGDFGGGGASGDF